MRGVICGVFALLAAAGIALTIYAFYTYYHIDYVPIPKYIVDEADITTYNEKGEKEFIRNDTAYYRAVDCNRETMNKGSFEKHYNKRIEEIGSRGDLNGAAGKEWLALYTVKNANGAPILADSLLVQTGEKSSSVPDGYTTGIHMFGEKNAYNLQNHNLLYKTPEAIRVYFKQDTQAYVSEDASTTGSFISSGSKILFLVIGFACGALVV